MIKNDVPVTPYLVRFKSDYADEFDCEGFFVAYVPIEYADDLLFERLKTIPDDDEFYFGTNEYLSGEEMKRENNFVFKRLTEAHLQTLDYMFGLEKVYRGVGTFPRSMVKYLNGEVV